MSTPQPAARSRGCCGCGGCMTTLLVVVVVFVVGAGLLFHAATSDYINLPAVKTSDAAANSAGQKLKAVDDAVNQAQNTGQPVPFSVSLSDQEMTSMVAKAVALAEQSGVIPSIDAVVVHAAGGGNLQVQAHVHELFFFTFPLYMSLHVATPNQQRVDVQVTEVRLGTIPLPAGVVAFIVDQVRQRLAVPLSLQNAQKPNIDHVNVVLASGQFNLTATAEP